MGGMKQFGNHSPQSNIRIRNICNADDPPSLGLRLFYTIPIIDSLQTDKQIFHGQIRLTEIARSKTIPGGC